MIEPNYWIILATLIVVLLYLYFSDSTPIQYIFYKKNKRLKHNF